MFYARGCITLAATVLIATQISSTQADERQVQFQSGATATTLKGVIRGDADANFTLQTVEGQALQTLLTVSNRSCYFNVFEPDQQDAAHIGSISGNEFGRNPTKAGNYRFQIYLMRNAARRNETCRYSLSIELTGGLGGASAGVSDIQMRDSCQTRVRDMYAVPFGRVRMESVRSGREGPLINGTVDKGAEGIKRFRCLFTPERQLRDVMAMTPDGE
jgi:hypothetical protein